MGFSVVFGLLAGCHAVQDVREVYDDRAAAEKWLVANPTLQREVGSPVSASRKPGKGTGGCSGDASGRECMYTFVATGPSGSREVQVTFHHDTGGEMVVDAAHTRRDDVAIDLVAGTERALGKRTPDERKRALDEEIAKRAGLQ